MFAASEYISIIWTFFTNMAIMKVLCVLAWVSYSFTPKRVNRYGLNLPGKYLMTCNSIILHHHTNNNYTLFFTYVIIKNVNNKNKTYSWLKT